MKNNKGITLIALVITIVVMLILVAVTVAFAINGDLFKRAKEGSAETEKHLIYDIIKGAMRLEDKGDSTFQVGEIRVYDTVQDAIDALEDAGYERTNISVEYKNGSTNETSKEAIMTVIGKLGTWKYKITTSEIIIYDGDGEENTGGGDSSSVENNVPEDLETYILGANKTGRSLFEISDMEDFFDDEELTPSIDESQMIEFVNMVDDCIYINYDNELYRFRLTHTDTFDVQELMESYYTAPLSSQVKIQHITADGEDLGKTVTISGRDYYVLYEPGEYGNKAQLITKDVVESSEVILGESNTLVDWTDSNIIAEADIFNGYTPGHDNYLSPLEKSIYSYNNAITLLNDACYDVLKDELIASGLNITKDDVRCVGTNPANKNNENTTNFTSDILAAIPSNDNNIENYENYQTGAFNNATGIGGKGKDYNWTYDGDRLILLGLTEANGNYWVASRIPNVIYSMNSEDTTTFSEVEIDYSLIHSFYGENVIWDVGNRWSISGGNSYSSLRPVISISASDLNTLLGD